MKRKNHSAVELPQAFVPFLGQVDGYRVTVMPTGEIVLTPPTAVKVGQNGHGRVPQLATQHAQDARQRVDRARLKYLVADKRLTPQRAETFGMSRTRLKVYKVIYKHKTGLLARDLMKQTGLPHGSIQQTLNWLRGHKLVAAKAVAA